MRDYKEMLTTLNKKVKQLDRIHNAVRKNGNEFATIQMHTLENNHTHLIKSIENWENPRVEMGKNRQITLTPDYWFETNYEDVWSNWIDWSPKTVTEDMNSYNGRHRPVVIIRSLWETRADFLFIYTKKMLFDYIRDINNEPAFNNMILGKRWEKDIEVDRVIKDEFDLLDDDDVIFITATGDDQENGVNIERIDYWNKLFHSPYISAHYETDLNELLEGLCSLSDNSEMFNL